jgi:ribose/xylose/arabinose/galactoside ABC-type transport system permease subunit
MSSRTAPWQARYAELTILGSVLVTVAALLTILTQGRLLAAGSVGAMAHQMPLLGVLTLAQMLPMLTGGIDLSIISTANFAGIVAAFLLTNVAGWYAVPAAVLAALAAALCVGALNGFLVAMVGVSPIIATLGSMIFVKGFALAITKGYVVAGFPATFLVLGSGSLLGLPVPFLIFAACAATMAVVLLGTPFGVVEYMLGSNPIATRFSGIDTPGILFRTYVIAAVLSGVAGLLLISRFNAAQADYGSSFLLLTVLIAVLGGIDPAGGVGTVLGLVIAVMILQVVSTGFNLMGFSQHLANALWGMILVLVIVFRRILEASGETL